MSGPRISVTKLAFYAEDPERFVSAKGQPYNAAAARAGEKSHSAIGRKPSKALFVLVTAVIVAAYLYLSH